jgi:hypothetical protein
MRRQQGSRISPSVGAAQAVDGASGRVSAAAALKGTARREAAAEAAARRARAAAFAEQQRQLRQTLRPRSLPRSLDPRAVQAELARVRALEAEAREREQLLSRGGGDADSQPETRGAPAPSLNESAVAMQASEAYLAAIEGKLRLLGAA